MIQEGFEHCRWQKGWFNSKAVQINQPHTSQSSCKFKKIRKEERRERREKIYFILSTYGTTCEFCLFFIFIFGFTFVIMCMYVLPKISAVMYLPVMKICTWRKQYPSSSGPQSEKKDTLKICLGWRACGKRMMLHTGNCWYLQERTRVDPCAFCNSTSLTFPNGANKGLPFDLIP